VEAVSARAPAAVLVAAFLTGAPGIARAEPAHRCALRVIAEPPELILGDSDRTTLRIETGGTTEPRVTASVGQIGAPRQVRPGVFAVDFVPPEDTIPELAIVAASAGEACGWATLRLVGQGEAIVRSTPGARIVVRIAERSYGPARADGTGIARLPVLVPPGVRVAYHGSRSIPLSVPPVRRLHVVLDHTATRADLDADVGVRIFATTDDGVPWSRARVEVAATAGVVSALTEVAPGELVARWYLPAGAARDETLVARIAGERPEASGRLSRPAGPVGRIEISPRVAAAAADVDEVQVDVRSLDAAGNPVDADIAPSAEPGATSLATRVSAGVARFSVLLPHDVGGRDRVEVTAAAGGLEARREIPLAAGAPARITAALSDPVLAADGRSTGLLRFAVLDRRGVPVPAAMPHVDAANVVVAVEPERPGCFVLSYRSPLRADDATATLRVEAAGLASAAEVQLVGARPIVELVPSVGMALTSRRASLETSVQAAAWSRRLGLDLGLALDVGWSATSESAPATAGAPALDAHARYLWLLARGGWRAATSQRALVWVTAGAGAARASSSMNVAGVPAFSEVAWVPAAGASVGWGIRAWRGFPFLEVGARWQGDPHLTGLSGALLPITFSAGYRFEAF
jgi:hypothetical protein